MALKDIFVHADNTGDCKSRFAVAVNLAAKHRAHLTAVYVPALGAARSPHGKNHPAIPDSLFGSGAMRQDKKRADKLVSDDYERIRHAGEKVKGTFVRHAERAGVPHHWVYDEMPLLDAFALHARFCDVLVITPPVEKDATNRQILTLGLPVMLVPKHNHLPSSVGERIIVAWDRSPVALRAVNNARPFLREATEVKVLSVNLPLIYRGSVSGSGIIEHLMRHDIKATRLRVETENARLSDVILSTARKEKADLIVMGAYGKRGIRERILGGVTSNVISDTSVPLLLTH